MPLFVTLNHKVLKPCGKFFSVHVSLRHIINYKVLKPQTSNLKLVITEPILLVIAVIYVHFYFIIKHLSQSII